MTIQSPDWDDYLERVRRLMQHCKATRSPEAPLGLIRGQNQPVSPSSFAGQVLELHTKDKEEIIADLLAIEEDLR